ncbi:MAG TPA: sugar transferase [Bacteroidetes bacterium]|nr:sugar transferase [Bacteroidota bacterium]
MPSTGFSWKNLVFFKRLAYRIRDIIIALLGLIGLSWLLLLIAILLRFTQKRVIFRQVRTGFREQPFTLIKFSTLRDILPGEREEDDQRKRLTVAGRILRQLSLDELPQLWHVLTGKMSLVGPRPLLHEYLPLYSEAQKRRFLVRPGITGWAQINGRNCIRFSERFELDQWYVAHQRFGLDLKIMWLTAIGFFRKNDVYADSATTSEKFDGTN